MKFLKEEELLEKKKKKWKNGLSITPFVIHKKDAGDVEKGIEAFNSAMTTGNPQGEVSGECQAMGEAIEAGQTEKAREIERDIQWYEEKEDDQPYNAGKYKTEISNLKQELKEDTMEKPNKPANKEAIIEFPINIEKEDIDRFLDLAKDYNLVKTHLKVNRFGGAHKYDLYFRGRAIDIFNFVKFVAEDEGTFFYNNFEEFVDDVWDTYPELFEENLKENKMEFKHLHEDLDNITEVEDKAKEVMDPTFASAVREIRSHDKQRAELKKLRKAPKEGKEVLPKDLKIKLEESLFTEWLDEDEEEEANIFYIVHSDIDENNIKREFDDKKEAIEYAKENAVDETWVDEVTIDPVTDDEYVDTIWVYDEDEE